MPSNLMSPADAEVILHQRIPLVNGTGTVSLSEIHLKIKDKNVWEIGVYFQEMIDILNKDE